ncbi:MAG: VRR-NUC domain-containing protein [Candidatus Hydrogenedentales bacterium]
MTADQLRAKFPHASEDMIRLNAAQLYRPGSTPHAEPYSSAPQSVVQATKKRIRQRTKPLLSSRRSESQDQQALVRWWDANCGQWNLEPNDLMAFPLQGARTKKNGARLKAEGMRAGTPDLFLAVPALESCGLWIEMKSEKGRTTDAQDIELERLEKRGYSTAVCCGFDEAQATIRAYLKWKLP